MAFVSDYLPITPTGEQENDFLHRIYPLEFPMQAAKKLLAKAAVIVAAPSILVPGFFFPRPDTGVAASTPIPDALPIGRRRQLLLDEALIESKTGLRRVLNQPKRFAGNPVVRPEKPWEGRSLDLYGSVIRDERSKTFKMWYWARPTPSSAPIGCYAESKDGVRWTKPNLDLIAWRGSTKNNLISQLGMGVVHSPNDSDPTRRFKALNGRRGAFSPDGIRWSTPDQSEDIPGDLAGDNVIPFSYDEATRQYLAFGKVVRESAGHSRRAVSVSFSTNFLQWSPADAQGQAQTVLTPDSLDDELARQRVAKYQDRCTFVDPPEWNLAQFYGHCGFPYAGNYLGLLWVFDISGWKPGVEKKPAAGGEDGPVTVQLTFSRDARRWERVGERGIFLPLGRARSWEAGSIYTVNRPIIVNDEIWIYYAGFQTTHGHPIWWDQDLEQPIETLQKRYQKLDFQQPLSAIGLAKLRLDGWVSLEAGSNPGSLTTKPLLFDGSRLKVNADASRGSLIVEVLDESRKPISGLRANDCRVVRSDSVHHEIKWSGASRLTQLRGKPVRLRFLMKNSKLYSFAVS